MSLNHTCHWPGCNLQVPPSMWGCKKHWFTLPLRIRQKVWAAYVPEQEITKDPSAAYIDVMMEVKEWSAVYIANPPKNHVRGKQTGGARP